MGGIMNRQNDGAICANTKGLINKLRYDFTNDVIEESLYRAICIVYRRIASDYNDEINECTQEIIAFLRKTKGGKPALRKHAR
jgi:hypothetical protein